MSIRIRNLASRFSLESGGGRVISSAQMLAHFHTFSSLLASLIRCPGTKVGQTRHRLSSSNAY